MLKENNKVLKCSNASPDWRGYVDFVNNVVVDGLSRVICASLDYLLDQVLFTRDTNFPHIHLQQPLQVNMQQLITLLAALCACSWWLCVCVVCFRPIYSVVCVHLFGALHILAALHLAVITALSDGSAGVTQEGVNTGAFFFFWCFFFAPPSSCDAFLHCCREKGSAVPFPCEQ